MKQDQKKGRCKMLSNVCCHFAEKISLEEQKKLKIEQNKLQLIRCNLLWT